LNVFHTGNINKVKQHNTDHHSLLHTLHQMNSRRKSHKVSPIM